MNKLPLTIWGVQEARAIDHLLIKNTPLSAEELMNRAGQAALAVLQEHWPQAQAITICCGSGNNGGDGYVLARLAKAQGLSVTLYQMGDPFAKATPETQQARQAWQQCGGQTQLFQEQPLNADVIVDALLGTGVRQPLSSSLQKSIQAINESGCPILALDVPSGLNVDTGESEHAVQAQATVTFISLKLGLLLEPAVDAVGTLYFDDLATDEQFYAELTPMARRLDYETLIRALPPRRLSAHKGTHGHVCLIGAGESAFSGAVALAGEAALRCGAGLASAVVPPKSLSLLARAPQELMCHALTDPSELAPILTKASVLVVGSGLGQNEWSQRFFQAALQSQKPLVVDADGLNLLAQQPQSCAHWILTPHLKEAARLLNEPLAEIKRDKMSAARHLQQQYGGIVVLKGAGTIIVSDQAEIFINAGAFPILATAGTGDVLAGLIGGLVAQGLSLLDAAKIGVVVHSGAAELEQALGERGMLASDLFLHLRSLLNPAGKR